MHGIHDEVSRSIQDRVSWQLGVGAVLGEMWIQGLRQYADLNMGMLKVTLEQGNLAARQLATARDARQFMSLAAAQLPSGASRGFDYGYYLAAIMSQMMGSAIQAFKGVPETGHEWQRLADRMADPFGWQFALSLLREMTESAHRFPADTARAARMALNINTPAWESGKLRIAYTGPGRVGR